MHADEARFNLQRILEKDTEFVRADRAGFEGLPYTSDLPKPIVYKPNPLRVAGL